MRIEITVSCQNFKESTCFLKITLTYICCATPLLSTIFEIEQIYIFAVLYRKWVPRNELFSSQIIRGVPRVFVYTHGISSFLVFAFSVWIMRRFVINYTLPQSRLEIHTISFKWRKQREYRMIMVKSSILISYVTLLSVQSIEFI